MSQNTIDFSVSPMSGVNAFDDIFPDMLENILSSNSGVSRPSYAAEGTLWIDKTDNNLWSLKVFNGTADIVMGTLNPTTFKFEPSGGLKNVLTTKGDIITADTSGNLIRLPIGSIGQLLTVKSDGTLGYITSTGANISLSNLSDVGLDAILPVGAVLGLVRSSAPTNSRLILCNGATLSRTTYAKLFSVIGTTFGVGDGSTTFALPDYRGKFLRGLGGNSASNFATTQASANLSHTHTGSSSSAGGHQHKLLKGNSPGGQYCEIISGNYKDGGASITNSTTVTTTYPTTSIEGAHSHTMSLNTSGESEARPINQALNYFIRY